jgi:Novel toxin 17
MADLASDGAADRTADLSATDKIGEAMRRSLPRLPGEAQRVVLNMLEPENLAIIGATVVVWAASHFFGVGEIVDLILLVVGVAALGFSVFSGARELYYFVTTAVNAQSGQDLDVAAQHFAQAVTILGAAVVQAVLMKGAARKVSPRGRPPIKPRIPDAPTRISPKTWAPESEPEAAPGSVGASKVWTMKSRLKAVDLPTTGRVRFVPPKGYNPSRPLQRGPRNGFFDRFGNEWVKGPSRTAGEPFEWDVQLSEAGRAMFGWASRDGSHLNVSLTGKITHK